MIAGWQPLTTDLDNQKSAFRHSRRLLSAKKLISLVFLRVPSRSLVDYFGTYTQSYLWIGGTRLEDWMLL